MIYGKRSVQTPAGESLSGLQVLLFAHFYVFMSTNI